MAVDEDNREHLIASKRVRFGFLEHTTLASYQIRMNFRCNENDAIASCMLHAPTVCVLHETPNLWWPQMKTLCNEGLNLDKENVECLAEGSRFRLAIRKQRRAETKCDLFAPRSCVESNMETHIKQ